MTSFKVLLGDYREVLSDVTADLILTSPPYNIGSKQPRQDGYRKLGRYDPKSYGAITDYPDSLPEAEYQASQADFLRWAAGHLSKHGVLVYNHKNRRNGKLISPYRWIDRVPELTPMEEVVWDRGSTHNHGRQLMWPTTERLYVFRRTDGTYPFINTNMLPQRSDVWRITPDRSGTGHNAPFPIALAEAAILAWSQPGELVCDPYAGSATTGVAALRLGRRFVGSEVLPKYHRLGQERLAGIRVAA